MILVICSVVDEPRACHIERIKSERKQQILYITTYIWHLEKMVPINLFAGQKYRLVDMAEERTEWEKWKL